MKRDQLWLVEAMSGNT